MDVERLREATDHWIDFYRENKSPDGLKIYLTWVQQFLRDHLACHLPNKLGTVTGRYSWCSQLTTRTGNDTLELWKSWHSNERSITGECGLHT